MAVIFALSGLYDTNNRNSLSSLSATSLCHIISFLGFHSIIVLLKYGGKKIGNDSKTAWKLVNEQK